MKKQFIPYELSVKLKELGFNEKCFDTHSDVKGFGMLAKRDRTPKILWQQAFEWFEKEFSLLGEIYKDYKSLDSDFDYGFSIGISISKGYNIASIKTYEEARLKCLNKLIELCQTKS